MCDTETIDRLFLELSQFTTAKTKREIDLKQRLAATEARLAEGENEWEHVEHCAVCDHHLTGNPGVRQCRCCEAEAALAVEKHENTRWETVCDEMEGQLTAAEASSDTRLRECEARGARITELEAKHDSAKTLLCESLLVIEDLQIKLTAAEDARDMFQRGLAATLVERDVAMQRLAAAEALLDSRAGKLLRKVKTFIVVAVDEPYFTHVFNLIRNQEMKRGTWDAIDEQWYQGACKEWMELAKKEVGNE